MQTLPEIEYANIPDPLARCALIESDRDAYRTASQALDRFSIAQALEQQDE